MDIKELRIKNSDALERLLAETRREMAGLRFQAGSGQLKQVHKISAARRLIARLTTLITEKTTQE